MEENKGAAPPAQKSAPNDLIGAALSAARPPSRPVFLYTVPDNLVQEVGVSELGFVTLTAEEELQAYNRGNKDSGQIATELAKACLVEADSKKLSMFDGTADSFWKMAHPKLRQLVTDTYAELHHNSDKDKATFLQSRRVRVA